MAKVTGQVVLLSGLLAAGATFAGWRLLARGDTHTVAIPERDQPVIGSESARSAARLETPADELAPRANPPAKELVRKADTEDPEARIVRMKTRMLAWKDSEHWERKYEAFTVDELKTECDRLDNWIYEASKVELEARFAAGLGEIVETGPAWTSPHFNPYDVYWVKGAPGAPWTKCSLPEDEFPEVFKQKALFAWLSQRVHNASATAQR